MSSLPSRNPNLSQERSTPYRKHACQVGLIGYKDQSRTTLEFSSDIGLYGKFAPVHMHTDVTESTVEARNVDGTTETDIITITPTYNPNSYLVISTTVMRQVQISHRPHTSSIRRQLLWASIKSGIELENSLVYMTHFAHELEEVWAWSLWPFISNWQNKLYFRETCYLLF